ncbi:MULTISPECIES: hypothetical protein [unclassified Streptomyces]|uniref:hypothetical protein n=1 Tax=unclassified Streptomyces TaxID=2593676 RepID=UPI00081B62A6|nr:MULTISPECIES: hypothetical protein [unclassified Streptomyces]SCE10799.1 hypothetical protein GA0115244_11713 [Streptomyces sp. DvalAA-19]
MASKLAGAISDGAFKVLLGAALAVSPTFGSLFGVPAWLMVVTGSAILISGTVEIAYAHRRSMAACVRLMFAYDTGWTVATVVALGVAWLGSTAGGEIWAGYQAVASLAFTVLLLRAPAAAPATAPATPVQPPTPDLTAGEPAP